MDLVRALCFLLVALAFVAWPVQGQSNQQSVVIFHDVSDDGYTFVGTPNQFAFALLNEDGSTNVHKNGRVIVKQNDVVLYETTGYATGHDYDALNTFLVTFPVEGHYTIEAEIVTPGGILRSDFVGYVVERTDLVPVGLELEAPSRTDTGVVNKFVYKLVDANKSIVAHSDVLIEVRDDSTQQLLFRTHTHSHDGPQEVQYAFAAPGTYSVKLVAYQAFPLKSEVAFTPVTLTKKVEVVQGQAGAKEPSEDTFLIAAPLGPGKNYKMFTSFDPDKTVGMFGNQRLNVIVYDPDAHRLVPHVDFAAVLKDPDGRVLFGTRNMHEYDGHLEVITANRKAGTYSMAVVASADGWSDTTNLAFDVAPPIVALANPPRPNVPLGAGPMIVSATGLESLKSGTPQAITFTASMLGGAPWQHSEIDLQVNTPEGVPFYLNKLHTHSDGRFQVNVTFPQPGRHTLVLDAEPVHRDAATSVSYKEPGGSIIVPVEVAPGPSFPRQDVEAHKATVSEAGGIALAPSVGLLTVALALLLGFLGRRT